VSPNLAGRLAGVFGLCAQVFAHGRAGLAHRCLVTGQELFDQADTAPQGALLTSSPAVYYAEPEWRNDMELGAVELYLGMLRIRDRSGLPHPNPNVYLPPAGRWADQYNSSRSAGKDTFNLFDVAALAHFDQVQVLRSKRYTRLQRIPHNGIEVPTDPASLLADLHDQIALADRQVDPFGLRNLSTGLDTVSHALGLSIEARLYDQLVRRPQFEQAAQDQIDWVLGRNAWGTSFVVAGGTGFPHCIAHQVANLSGTLDGHPPVLTGAAVNGPTAPAGLKSLGAPDGHRACSNPLPKGLDTNRMVYRDDVGSYATSEPSDDLTALSLLAFAQASAR
jgi:endoglucanase